MNEKNLIEILHGHEVEHSELEEILSRHFGRSKAVRPNEIHYQRDDDGPVMITLIYDDNDQIQSIEASPYLQQDDLVSLKNKIRESLVLGSELALGRHVLFASVPTNGQFRYKDIFQLLPVPPEAPRPKYLMGDHPLYLEFVFPGSADSMIRISRKARRGRELELVCVALIPSIHGSLGNQLRNHWVIPENDDPAQVRSAWLQEMYTWPQISAGETAHFTETSRTPSLARVPANDYYNRRGIRVGDDLNLADTIERYLDSFFFLDRNDKDQFLRASYWLRHAQQVFTYSQSASFTALVSAIEALMGPTPKSESCKTCGKATGSGPTKRFIDFVEQHAPGPNVEPSDRRHLYALRSKLAHGGHLLHSDHGTWGGALSPSYLSQWQDMGSMWAIVRLTLINWLDGKRTAVVA